MLLDQLIVALTLIVLLIASYIDIKTSEIPDLLNYSFLFGIFGLRLIFAITGGWHIVLGGILGFAVCYALASLFYYTHQWGGGDSKLLMGVGAAIGIRYPLGNQSILLLWFLLGLLFIGALYGLLWMIILGVQKRKQFVVAFTPLLAQYRITNWSTGIVSLILVIILGIWNISLSWVGLFPIFLFYLIMFIKSIEQSCFTREIPVQQLTEGDWLARDVIVHNRTVVHAKTIEREDLKELRSLHAQGKVHLVTIKEGVPFTPSFLASYLVVIVGYSYWIPVVATFFGAAG